MNCDKVIVLNVIRYMTLEELKKVTSIIKTAKENNGNP